MKYIPIFLVKNGITFPIEKLDTLEKPFSFALLNGKEFIVEKNEEPLFFARKRRKFIKGRPCPAYVYRYCVGTKLNNKETKHWIFPDGTYDQSGINPS